MTISDLSRSARAVALAASAAMLLAAACSRVPSPDAYGEPPPPPNGPTAELLGEGPPPPDYAPEPSPAYADRGPPDRYAEAPPPPPPAYASPGPQRPPVVIAMEPIPNPPEKPRRERSHRRTARLYADHAQRPAAATPPRRAKPQRQAQARRKPAAVAQARPAAPARPAQAKAAPPKAAAPKVAAKPAAPKAAPAAKPAPKLATGPAAKPAPVAAAPKIAAPPKPPVVAKAPPPAPVVPAKPPELASPKAAPPLIAPQDRAAKLAGLQTALTQALAKAAVFKAPERFTAGVPAEVTLEVPVEFGDVVLSEAQKAGLSDVAASVNLTSVLSGDGFSVTPSEMAAQPLMPGQATRFAWLVTAMRNAKGPLHADMGADLSGAESLDLGSLKVADGNGRLSPRLIGATLLVLIAALVVAWLARGRKAPPPAKRPAAASPPPAPAPEPKPTPAPEPVHADTMARTEPPAANDPEKT